MIRSNRSSPIGIFDSGVGGLSVLRSIRAELPNESILYVADQIHVPYGPRPMEEVRSFAVGITKFLLSQGSKLIVVACNAASAAALQHLRDVFPETIFVGMEPAVKPAAEYSASKIVAVLATPATFQGELYASVVERFASGVILLPHTCPGLVEQIEVGDLDGPVTRQIIRDALLPLIHQGADTVVLGCTHYPLVIPLIQEICGSAIRVIDPAPAVARQTKNILKSKEILTTRNSLLFSKRSFYTTGNPARLQTALCKLINIDAEVHKLNWLGDTLGF